MLLSVTGLPYVGLLEPDALTLLYASSSALNVALVGFPILNILNSSLVASECLAPI